MRTPRACVAGLALLAVAVLRPAPARAYTLIAPPKLEDIATGASLALRGEVVAVEQRSADIGWPNRFPYQRISIRVDRPYAGAAPGQIVSFFQYGGAIPGLDRVLAAPALPSYRVGDQVAVFLNDRQFVMLGTLFGELGVRRVVTLPDGSQAVLSQTWTPMIHDPSGALRTTSAWRCVPAAPVRHQCVRWVHQGAGGESLQFPPELPWVRPPELDAWVDGVRASLGGAGGPAQTIGMDEPAFVQALQAWRGPGHAPVPQPPVDLPPPGDEGAPDGDPPLQQN